MKNHFGNFILLSFTMIALSSCDDSKNETTPKPEPEPIKVTTKGLQIAENTTHGKILTDANGKTLYYFADDVDGKSACSGDCLLNWPLYHSTDVTTDTKVDKSQIAEITRADGKKQTTYKGWPLYYFKDDTKASETKGDKVGEIWYVAKPDYTIMVARAQLLGNDGKNYISTGEGIGKTLYLTDDKGKTLYIFKNDTENKNNYTKNSDNDKNWPIYTATLNQTPSYINKSLIAKTTVLEKSQLTYKGWPLYYFGLDTKRGETKGVSMGYSNNVFTWPIINEKTSAAIK